MAKIPQGEWSAIAERYSRGEPISSIARHYGCTAPAIHYILKRHKERSAGANQPSAFSPTPTKPELAQPDRISDSAKGEKGTHDASDIAAKGASRAKERVSLLRF